MTTTELTQMMRDSQNTPSTGEAVASKTSVGEAPNPVVSTPLLSPNDSKHANTLSPIGSLDGDCNSTKKLDSSHPGLDGSGGVRGSQEKQEVKPDLGNHLKRRKSAHFSFNEDDDDTTGESRATSNAADGQKTRCGSLSSGDPFLTRKRAESGNLSRRESMNLLRRESIHCLSEKVRLHLILHSTLSKY